MKLSSLLGQTLDDKYLIDKQLGKGGMGAVYLATHIGTGRPVAVKVITPQFMANDEFVDQVAGSHAVTATALRDRTTVDDRYLASEQALPLGHRFHPTPKSRTAASGDWRAYAPETGSRFPLRYLAVRADRMREATVPGADLPHVRTLRSFADCRAIIERAKAARRAVVLGASFIGLEVAASLRARGIEVHVVAPEKRPMERILGPQMGDFVRSLHAEHGVTFHLEDVANAIDGKQVKLKSGGAIDADLVVAGIGVRPRTELAEKAGLALDRGVKVDACLETSVPGIFAAGDIARWPDPYSGASIRVEHWVVAERQGQTAALNMLGHRERFTAVPYFWSQHYDVPINYVGHAESWDELAIDGDIAAKDCLLRYKRDGRVLAVASIYRDVESLEAEVTMERHPA